MLVPVWYPTNSQNLDGESQTRVLDFCQAAVTGWQPGFLQMCLILIDKVGSQMCSNLGSWNWVSSWQTCRYVFLSDFWWNFLSIAVVDLRLISVKQCKNICPWLQLGWVAAVLGNWSDILHSEQPESSQTDGLQPFGVLELLQLRGTERHLPQGRVQGLTDKAWQAFSVSSCTCTEPTTRNRSGDTWVRQFFGFWCFKVISWKVANRMQFKSQVRSCISLLVSWNGCRRSNIFLPSLIPSLLQNAKLAVAAKVKVDISFGHLQAPSKKTIGAAYFCQGTNCCCFDMLI